MCVNERVSGVYTHILSPSACLAAPVLLCSSHTTLELDGITLPQILIHTKTLEHRQAVCPSHGTSCQNTSDATLNEVHSDTRTESPAEQLLSSSAHTHTHTASPSHACLFQSPYGQRWFRDIRKAARRLSPSLTRGLNVPGVSAAVKQTLQPVKPSSNTAYLLSNSGALWFPSQLTVSYEPFVSAGEGKQRSEFGRKI